MQISGPHYPVLPASGPSPSPVERRNAPGAAGEDPRPARVPATRTLEGELLNGARGLTREAAPGQGEPPLDGGGNKGREQELSLNARRAVSAYQSNAPQDESEYLRTALGIDIYV